MRKIPAVFAWMLIICLLLPALGLAAGESVRFVRIYQPDYQPEMVHVVVEATGLDGRPLTGISAEDIPKATMGSRTIDVEQVTPLSDPSQPMAYVFLLDTSLPISNDRVKEMKAGLHAWIDTMRPEDQAAILFFAEEIEDKTGGLISDKEKLKEIVDSYKSQDSKKTRLYEALKKGTELLAYRGLSAPDHHCMVVVSDGVEDYQTVVTAGTVSGLLEEHGIPLYVAGFAYRQNKPALATLIDMAKASGGWAEDASPSSDTFTLEEALILLRDRIIDGGYDIVLNASDFVVGGSTNLSLRFGFMDKEVSTAANVLLLSKPSEEDDEETAPPTTRPTIMPKPIEGSGGGSNMTTAEDILSQANDILGGRSVNLFGGSIPMVFFLAGAAVLVVFLILLILLLRRVEKQSSMIKAMGQEKRNVRREAKAENKAQPQDAELNLADTMRVTQEAATPPAQPGTAPRPQSKEQDLNTTLRVSYHPDGSDLPTVPTGLDTTVREQPLTLKLSIHYPDGRSEEREAVVHGFARIGRSTDNEIIIANETVSGSHARIDLIANVPYLRNVSKGNQLFLNKQIVEEPAALKPGDELVMGRVILTLQWNQETPE